jgi:hypothetical protein
MGNWDGTAAGWHRLVKDTLGFLVFVYMDGYLLIWLAHRKNGKVVE